MTIDRAFRIWDNFPSNVLSDEQEAAINKAFSALAMVEELEELVDSYHIEQLSKYKGQTTSLERKLLKLVKYGTMYEYDSD